MSSSTPGHGGANNGTTGMRTATVKDLKTLKTPQEGKDLSSCHDPMAIGRRCSTRESKTLKIRRSRFPKTYQMRTRRVALRRASGTLR